MNFVEESAFRGNSVVARRKHSSRDRPLRQAAIGLLVAPEGQNAGYPTRCRAAGFCCAPCRTNYLQLLRRRSRIPRLAGDREPLRLTHFSDGFRDLGLESVVQAVELPYCKRLMRTSELLTRVYIMSEDSRQFGKNIHGRYRKHSRDFHRACSSL